MFCISPLRMPSFSMHEPTAASGTSITSVSTGSQGVPSMVRKITCGWDTWNSYPSRRIVSIRIPR